MKPGELLAKARSADEQHKTESAAKLYMQAAEAYATDGRFQEAGDLFQKAADRYIALGKPESVEHALINSSNCFMLAGKHLFAFIAQWLLAEYKTSKGKISEASFPSLAELIDPHEHDYSIATESLKILEKSVQLGVVVPYVTFDSQKSFYDFFKSMPSQDGEALANHLSILFARAYLMDTSDRVAQLYFELAKALADRRNEIISKWREILATLAYARACVVYAQKGDFKDARETDQTLETLRRDVKSIFGKDAYLELRYELYEKMEALLAKNFQEADRYYFKRMQTYTDILFEQKHWALGIVYRLWGISTGYGVGIFRALTTIAILSIFVFPLIYCGLWLYSGIPFQGIVNSGLIRNVANAIYFSIVTFTTLGFGDISPIGWAKLIAVAEVFAGYVSLALVVTIIARKMLRK